MNLMLLFFQISFLLTSIISYKSEENKYYFQLYPSEDRDKPYQFHIFNLNSEFSTINSTDGENMKFISTVKRAETPIKHLSSVIKYNNRFLIKTCFGPNKIVEIIDENNGQSYTPDNIYFKNVQNNLEGIEYCYSTVLQSPFKYNEYVIVTYWTEKVNINGKDSYAHKMIKFNPGENTFGEIKNLDTKNNIFYAQSCTTLGYRYIYCNIDPAFTSLKNYHFTIDAMNLIAENGKINLALVLARFSNSLYHKPIGILKEGYTLTGKTAHYFLTEYHDKEANKTRLMTSVYINNYFMSFILRFETLGIYHGINIEDRHIDPNLFNHLLPKDELIIIYIMKGAEGKNLLLLNEYNYQQSLHFHYNFEKYSLSNYLREDICENPKYMQSSFLTTFINYDESEKQKIKYSPGDYFKYQRDIGIVITCDKGDGEVLSQAKKIAMPQCLNDLYELNGIENKLILTSAYDKVVLDIKNNPNYRSLKNVEIEFFDSNLYNKILIVQAKKNGINQNPIDKATTISNIDELAFFATLNLKKGKTYQVPYRIKQTGFSGVSSTCHLTSDMCYFEIKYEGEGGNNCPVNYCRECDNNLCIECNPNIIGLKLNKDKTECACDEYKGFEKKPNTSINMCICKEGYSFFQNITSCLPDFILNSGDYCITGQDERSLINIYEKITGGMTKYILNGLPYCEMPQYDESSLGIWFKMGPYEFKSAKVDNCVYIIYKNEIFLYSNRADCNYKYFDYKNYLNLNINNEQQYYSALEKAYDYSSQKLILFEPDDNKKFYILNENTSQTYSSVYLSKACIEKVKKEYNLDSILIFVASIKNPRVITTQVEYGFYNPNPEFINQKLNMSICTIKETPIQEPADNSTMNKRRVQFNFNSENDVDLENIEQDEVILKVQIDWDSEHMKKIKDLYIERGINIFDPLDPFYNDVCYKFDPPGYSDLYPQDRREIYFIREALCENNCEQIGYEKENERMICKCKIKENPDNYESVTFNNKDLDEVFGGTIKAPNIKTISCIGKLNMKKNRGFYFGLGSGIIFILLILCWRNHKKYSKEEEEINVRQSNEQDGKKKYKKEILFWEIPFEYLLNLLDDLVKAFDEEEEEEKENNKDEEENDPEFGINDFRLGGKIIPQKNNEPVAVIYYKDGNNIGDKPIRNIHNGPDNFISKPNTETIKINIGKIKKEEKEESSNPENSSESKSQKGSLIDDETSDNKEQNKNNSNNEVKNSLNQDIDTSSQKNEEEKTINSKLNKLNESIEKQEPKKNEDEKSEVPTKTDYGKDDKDKDNLLVSKSDNHSQKQDEDKKSEVPKMNYSSKYDDDKQSEKEFDFKITDNVNMDTEEIHEYKAEKKVIIVTKKKVKKKNKNENKPNPPKNKDEVKNSNGPASTTRESLRKIDVNKSKDNEKNMSKLDKFYKDIIYDIKTKTNNSKSFSKFQEKNSYAFIKIFLSKFLSNSTLFFIIPWWLFTYSDKDFYFVKLLVLLLFVAFYMSFNLITATKISTLHLWTSESEMDSPSAADRFINYFIPFIILYLPIGWMKRSLSKTVIYFNLSKKIDELKKEFNKTKRNYNPDEKKKELKKLKMNAKELDTEIKKQRNQMETKTRITLLYGGILLFINFILLTHFCGIYSNSFGSLFYNMLSSMMFTFVFSFALQLISTAVKYLKCSTSIVRFKLSEWLSCQYLVFYTYYALCKISFCICCDCFREEFYEDQGDKANNDETKDKDKSQNSDTNSINATKKSYGENQATGNNSIIINNQYNGNHQNGINQIIDYIK